MATKKFEWSVEKARKAAATALVGNYSFDSQRRVLQDWISRPETTPQEIGGLLRLGMAVTRWFEALLSIDKGETDAWRKAHLVWRYYAFGDYVYLQRLNQLASSFPDKLKSGRLGIGLVSAQLLAQQLMTTAFSASLGEDEAADWLCKNLLGMILDREPKLLSDALTIGTTQAFLLRLYGLWRQVPIDFSAFGITNFGAFQAIFDNWGEPKGLEEATLQICILHSRKAADLKKPNDDLVFGLQTGPFRELPVEILFLQRIRRDLGLSVPNPEHSLLRSSLMKMPFPCPKSEVDSVLSELIEKCRAAIPNLALPWRD